MSRVRTSKLVLLLVASISLVPSVPGRASPGTVIWEGRIASPIPEDASSIEIERDPRPVELQVELPDLKKRLKSFEVGDQVVAEVDEAKGLLVAIHLLLSRTGVVDSISDDQALLVLRIGSERRTVTVPSPGLRSLLKKSRPGDRVNVKLEDGTRLNAIEPVRVPVGRWNRFLFLGGSALAAFVLFAFVRRVKPGKSLLLGEDGRYSKSKFQMVVWFGVVVTTYIATVLLRGWEGGCGFIGGVDLPKNLILLSGMSGLTLGTAKGLKMASGRRPAAASGSSDGNLLRHLVTDDQDQPDLGDFQMVILTLLAAGVHWVQTYCFLGSLEMSKVVMLPDVDTTILSLFGLGQGAYLVKKYAESR